VRQTLSPRVQFDCQAHPHKMCAAACPGRFLRCNYVIRRCSRIRARPSFSTKCGRIPSLEAPHKTSLYVNHLNCTETVILTDSKAHGSYLLRAPPNHRALAVAPDASRSQSAPSCIMNVYGGHSQHPNSRLPPYIIAPGRAVRWCSRRSCLATTLVCEITARRKLLRARAAS
jgi:hypothetical protein